MLIGEVEVTALVDGVGAFARYASAYPDVPSDAWHEYRERFPDHFDGDLWRLPMTSYHLRAGDTTVLVDTGVGPPGSWDWEAEDEALLPSLVDRDDVDVVFLTHLHVDHVGWNVGADGAAFFPNARYVVHREALAFAREHADRGHIQRAVLPVEFEEIAGETELAAGVTAFPLPGHFPGHMGLRIGGDAVLMADAAVHPALLEHPEWRYVADGDHEQCVATRRTLVAELDGTLLACGHYFGGGFGRLAGGRWEPLA